MEFDPCHRWPVSVTGHRRPIRGITSTRESDALVDYAEVAIDLILNGCL